MMFLAALLPDFIFFTISVKKKRIEKLGKTLSEFYVNIILKRKNEKTLMVKTTSSF